VLIANEKKRIIAKDKVLEWHDPLPGGLDDVGGLDLLKRWLISHTAAYSPDARAYGLPLPKGVLLVGVPGCGKTYTAKAFATALACPLVRLDLNALKGKFVGQSEQNLRTAIRVIEALGRVVVWIDEIEKSLQGATSDSADGGVSSDALGTMLSWMQERTSGAFVIATANDVSKLPPELLRKGRFDEIFFVDAPNATERLDVLKAALRSHKRPADCVDAPAQVVKATEGFTGSEIANLVPEAMFAAYSDGKRQINTDDLIEAARNVVPLTTTAKEKVAALRAWAKERARPATSIESVTRKTRGAALDIDA
jgi:SpoVK/Ycf46/Vps4 family AAA+-type ATPase